RCGRMGTKTQQGSARRAGGSDERQGRNAAGRCRDSACASRAAEMTQTEAVKEPPMSHLMLTARLNTSALDARRGVVRLHPEAIAALGIREWDAVSLTGSRSDGAVARVGSAGTP